MNNEGYGAGVILGVCTVLAGGILAWSLALRKRVIESAAFQARVAVERELTARNVPVSLASEAGAALQPEVRAALQRALP